MRAAFAWLLLLVVWGAGNSALAADPGEYGDARYWNHQLGGHPPSYGSIHRLTSDQMARRPEGVDSDFWERVTVRQSGKLFDEDLRTLYGYLKEHYISTVPSGESPPSAGSPPVVPPAPPVAASSPAPVAAEPSPSPAATQPSPGPVAGPTSPAPERSLPRGTDLPETRPIGPIADPDPNRGFVPPDQFGPQPTVLPSRIRQALIEAEEEANDVHSVGGRPLRALVPVASPLAAVSAPVAPSIAKADPFAIWADRKNDEIDQAIAGVQDPKASPEEVAKRMKVIVDLYEGQGGDPKQISIVRETINELSRDTRIETLALPDAPTAKGDAKAPSDVLGAWLTAAGDTEGEAKRRGIASFVADVKNGVPGPQPDKNADKASKGIAVALGLPPKSPSAPRPELKKISSSLLRDLAATMRSQHRQHLGWLAGGGGPALASAKRKLSSVSPTLSAAMFPGDPDSPSPVPLGIALTSLVISGLLAWNRAKKRAAYLARSK